jgi:hypothetical protein
LDIDEKEIVLLYVRSCASSIFWRIRQTKKQTKQKRKQTKRKKSKQTKRKNIKYIDKYVLERERERDMRSKPHTTIDA